MTMTKVCIVCKQDLPLSDYHKQKGGKMGAPPRCRKCQNEWLRAKGPVVRVVAVVGKICSKCHIDHPLSEFHKNKTGAMGLSARCSKCRREDRAAIYARDKEKVDARNKAYRMKNLDKVNETVKKYTEKNREKIRDRATVWYKNNKERALRRIHEYSKNHPEYAIEASNRRRVRIKDGAVGDREEYKRFVKMVSEADVAFCYYCDKEVEKGDRQLDHIVPIAKHGLDSIYNLACACSRCNRRKHSMLPEEFSGQYHFEFDAHLRPQPPAVTPDPIPALSV